MTTDILAATDIETGIEEEDPYALDLSEPYNLQEEIDVREDQQSVFEWMRRFKKGGLNIDPDFQRNRVWKDFQRSRFIESVLMGIPLPPLYVNQTRDGLYLLIDGLQRTTTLYSYIEEQSFALDPELQTIANCRGKRFNELPPLYQARIEDRKMLVYVIKPSVDIRVVYDIFDRINSGGTPLNRQELRNSYFVGPSTKLLKELAESDAFRLATDFSISPDRMRDREAVLRCLAFEIRGVSNYRNDMDAFLKSAMELLNRMDDVQRNIYRIEFLRTVKNVYYVLENRSFRIGSQVSRGRINVAVMESVYALFTRLTDDQISENAARILQNYQELMANIQYLEAVTRSTGTTSRVVSRFRIAAEILERGLC